MVKIKLVRIGAQHKPFYRLVVLDARKAPGGSYIDLIGHYNPVSVENKLVVEEEKTLDWLRKGVQPTKAALVLLKKAGVWQKFISNKSVN